MHSSRDDATIVVEPMDPQLQGLVDRIASDVTAKVTASVTQAVNEHVTQVITAAEIRLAEQARINVEAVKEESRRAAEGYAATVDAINRRLGGIETRLDTKFNDYDAVLKSHNARITSLEQENT